MIYRIGFIIYKLSNDSIEYCVCVCAYRKASPALVFHLQYQKFTASKTKEKIA